MPLTILQLAARIGVHSTTVRRWIRSRKIPAASRHSTTSDLLFDDVTVEKIEREYMQRVAENGTRGPGSEDRRKRALAFVESQARTPSACRESPAQIVTQAANTWLELGDEYFPAALLVVAMANKIADEPVWLMIVAPASSGKTQLLVALASRKDAYILSKITDKTFASGMLAKGDKGKDPSLLVRLQERGQWLLALKDFGTIYTLPYDKREQVFAQLREIFDGKFAATYGTGVEVDWDGKLAVLAAATPTIDRGKGIGTSLGERFVQYRPASGDPSKVALKAQVVARMPGGSERMRQELKDAYARAFDLALAAADDDTGAGRYAAVAITGNALAQLVADARRDVFRPDGPYGDAFLVAESEGPGRLTKIFEAVGRAAIACFGTNLDAALHIMIRFAMDSITPGHRSKLLLALAAGPEGLTVRRAAEVLDCDDNTARRYLEDLVHLKLARRKVSGTSHVYFPSAEFEDYACRIFHDEYSPEVALQKLSDRPTILPPERERKKSVSRNARPESPVNRAVADEGEGV